MSDSEVSQISNLQQVFFFIDAFGVGIIGLILSILIYSNLRNTKLDSTDSNDPKFYQYGINFARLSILFSMMLFVLKILFINDLIIPWDFVHNNFGTINDSIYGTVYIIQKIMFLYSFSFHIQSLSAKNHLTNLTKFWFVISGIICFITASLIIISDAIMMSPKEVGVTESGNIYILMYLGFESDNDSDDYLNLAVFISYIIYFVVIWFYYAVLLWSYMYALQSIDDDNINFIVNHRIQRVKGAVIIFVSLIIYSLDSLEILFHSDIGWLLDNIPVIIDSICLFLVFKGGAIFYDKSCGCLCHSCCKKIMFGSNNDDERGDAIPLQRDTDSETDV